MTMLSARTAVYDVILTHATPPVPDHLLAQYARAVWNLLGHCEPERDMHRDIATNIEDYLWIKVCTCITCVLRHVLTC